MSYPIQKIVSDTIAGLQPGQHSCIALKCRTCDILVEMYGDIPLPWSIAETVEPHIADEYTEVSNANPHHSGFNGMYKREADQYSKELFNYRLEMLYYFWMANQEM